MLADSARLTQILTNLCNNAVKFTERGGVKLSVHAELKNGLRCVTFSVTDTGVGMTPEAQTRLFKRFSQADGSISRRFGGTGLGLSICRSLTELMGGEIKVHSEEVVGSTFTATFELPPVEAPASCDAGAEIVVSPPRTLTDRLSRVLLAEDHPVNRQVVQLILGEVAELTTVVNGSEAVAYAGSNVYEVILMDMHMPVLDVASATRTIRLAEQAEGRPAVPIIMLTADVSSDHVALSRKAAVNAYLMGWMAPVSGVDAP